MGFVQQQQRPSGGLPVKGPSSTVSDGQQRPSHDAVARPDTQDPSLPMKGSAVQQQPQVHRAPGQGPAVDASASNEQVPPAPTSVQPPFPLGASSPQGVPIYGKAESTSTNLKPPPAKRRKNNQRAGETAATKQSTPATVPQASPPASSRPTSKDEGKANPTALAKPPKEAPVTHRCPTIECDFNLKGFASADELARHQADVHDAPEEHIEDPVRFALESLATFLGLNPDGTRKAPEPTAPPESKTKGVDTTGPVRITATPSRMGQTPRSSRQGDPSSAGQLSSQTSHSAGQIRSAASRSIHTPHTASSRSPPGSTLNPVKRTQSSDGKTVKGEFEGAPMGLLTPASMWSDSGISPESLRSCFDGLDGITDISVFNQLPPLTPEDTPPSAKDGEGGGRDGKISENDKLQIDLKGSFSQVWNPFGLYGNSNIGTDGENALANGGEDPFEMAWDTSFDDGDGLDSKWKGNFIALGFDAGLFEMRV